MSDHQDPIPFRSWRQARHEGALLFHHTRPLEHSPYDLVPGLRLSDVLERPDCPAEGWCPWDDWHDALHMEAAYRWLAERVGFWPLWLAVGADEEALYMTGYEHQFSRIVAWHKDGNSYRKKGEFPSDVLFSWRAPPPLVRYLDYDWWFLPLNAIATLDQDRHQLACAVEPHWERRILRPSWPSSRWLTHALREPASTQAVAPLLDLRSADLVRVRSEAARQELIARGFDRDRVAVFRLKVRRWR